MVTRGNRKTVDRSQADKYRRVGAALLESAQALSELATDSDSYGNAIAVVAVHACIAYNDALSIAWKGVKSTDGDHTRAPDTLLFALSHNVPPERVRQLKAVVAKMDHVSYRARTTTPTKRHGCWRRRPGSAPGRRRSSNAGPRCRRDETLVSPVA